jgi:hypothetical protein
MLQGTSSAKHTEITTPIESCVRTEAPSELYQYGVVLESKSAGCTRVLSGFCITGCVGVRHVTIGGRAEQSKASSAAGLKKLHITFRQVHLQQPYPCKVRHNACLQCTSYSRRVWGVLIADRVAKNNKSEFVRRERCHCMTSRCKDDKQVQRCLRW